MSSIFLDFFLCLCLLLIVQGAEKKYNAKDKVKFQLFFSFES